MARARMLATDASIDPELNSLTLPALTLYLLTIPHLDRDGLIDANPVRLAALAAPLRPDIRDSAGAIINEWVEVGLVVRYPAARNQAVLYFKGFRKHNPLSIARNRHHPTRRRPAGCAPSTASSRKTRRQPQRWPPAFTPRTNTERRC